MLKFRQTQVKNKVVQLGSVTAILAVYWVLPTLIRIMAECQALDLALAALDSYVNKIGLTSFSESQAYFGKLWTASANCTCSLWPQASCG